MGGTDKEKHMAECFMCGRQFQISHHIYEGKRIARYDIFVCVICYNSNWDGWAPDYERRLVKHLKKKRIPIPKRNEKGWLPRE